MARKASDDRWTGPWVRILFTSMTGEWTAELSGGPYAAWVKLALYMRSTYREGWVPKDEVGPKWRARFKISESDWRAMLRAGRRAKAVMVTTDEIQFADWDKYQFRRDAKTGAERQHDYRRRKAARATGAPPRRDAVSSRKVTKRHSDDKDNGNGNGTTRKGKEEEDKKKQIKKGAARAAPTKKGHKTTAPKAPPAPEAPGPTPSTLTMAKIIRHDIERRAFGARATTAQKRRLQEAIDEALARGATHGLLWRRSRKGSGSVFVIIRNAGQDARQALSEFRGELGIQDLTWPEIDGLAFSPEEPGGEKRRRLLEGLRERHKQLLYDIKMLTTLDLGATPPGP